MSLSFNIAIDGYSSCGKSTIAKHIAIKYGMNYIDSGAMYRAVALYCMRFSIVKNKKLNLDKLNNHIDNIAVDYKFNIYDSKSSTFLNNENVEDIIRNIDVSENVSIVAKIPTVREKLILMQKKMSSNGNVVMDGRDIGSVVLPNAKIKFFVTATTLVRAKRRYDELIINGQNVSFSAVKENIENRDKQDLTRNINPLVKVKDAITLDTSNFSMEEQNNFIESIVDNELKKENESCNR